MVPLDSVIRPAGLTPRQREIAAYVQQFSQREGRPPSRADLAQHFGFNRASAQQHIVALERHGVLRRTEGARGLVLAAQPATPRASSLPVIGRVPAGTPIAAVEDPEEWLELPDGYFRRTPDVFLRVVGDSMRDAGIIDGDLVAVVLKTTADSGQIVVARLDDEITIKRLRIVRRVIELRPENPAFSPIRVDGTRQFAVEGVVVGLIRRM